MNDASAQVHTLGIRGKNGGEGGTSPYGEAGKPYLRMKVATAAEPTKEERDGS